MPRYLLVGDIHLADRPPSSCTATYLEDLFALLEQTVVIEDRFECDATIWAGDVFHVKAASRNSHKMVQRTIEIGKQYKAWLIVPGNHDMEHDRIDSLAKQPLGTLFKAGAVPCVGNITPTLYGVPWQQDWAEFRPPMCESNELVVAHAPLYPAALRPPHDEYVSMAWWASQQRGGSVYYGHVHDLHGVTRERDPDTEDQLYDVWFCNQGALTRGSLHEDNLLRKVAVTIWDPELLTIERKPGEEGPFKRIELEHRPASEVFRLSDVKAVKDAKLRLDEFVEAVGSTVVDRVTTESVLAAASAKLTDTGQKLVKHLLEQVS